MFYVEFVSAKPALHCSTFEGALDYARRMGGEFTICEVREGRHFLVYSARLVESDYRD